MYHRNFFCVKQMSKFFDVVNFFGGGEKTVDPPAGVRTAPRRCR